MKFFPQKPTRLVSAHNNRTVTDPQESVAVGTSKVQGAVHSTSLSGTQVMIGAVVSTTVTVWLQAD